MRKASGIMAVALAVSCVVISGCSGCSSCNNTGKNVAPLASNWYTYTGYRNIQPTFIEGESELKYKEKLVYDVEFKKPSTGNATYSVEYKNGSYTTEFYAKKFDTANLVHEDYQDGYEGKNIIAYYYHTEFSATVTYEYGSKTSDELDANITTDCYFLSVEDELRPLYSKQVVKSPSPATFQATSLSSCYTLYNEIYENFYSYSGRYVTTKITDLDKDKTSEKERSIGGRDNSLFDVNALDIVLRALVGSSFDQTIELYTPINSINSFNLSSPSTGLGNKRNDIAKALSAQGLYISDESEENFGKNLKTTAVTVTANSELKGVSQTYWFAKVENKRNNVGRATLLKISLPIVYNLGTLEYTLKEVTSTLWNE